MRETKRVKRKHSSVGRASALQAEGHRFEPYCFQRERSRGRKRYLSIVKAFRFCGPVVQMVRTLACHARGQGFEPPSGRHFFKCCGRKTMARDAFVAQLVEQRTENPRVVGSIPTGGTNADLAHLVERDLAKVEVAGSSPVIR